MAKEKNAGGHKVVADNRKARHNYEIVDTVEAGIALTGTEVKSLRANKATIGESYAGPSGNELFLFNANIPEYLQANRFNHEPRRPRRLLLHKRQIDKFIGSTQRDGFTLIPLKLYFNERGRAKIELGLGRGKQLHDKRQAEKKKDWDREKGPPDAGQGIDAVTLPVRLDHCVIHVSDWERSTAFYRDVLGAEPVPTRPGFAYRFGTVQLNCHGPGKLAEPVARLPVMPGNSDLCFVWDGPIEEAQAHLERHGVPVELGPTRRPGARGEGTSLYFRDPDGSLLEFIVYGEVTP